MQAVTGQGGALIGDGRVVPFALPPRVTAMLFAPPPRGDIFNTSCPNIRRCYLFRLQSSMFRISTRPLAVFVQNRYG